MNSFTRAALLAPTALLALLPLSVSAHETQVFEINHTLYKFVIGSLGEPVMVDDKSGVDLRVYKASGHTMPGGTTMAGMSHGDAYESEVALSGLEKTLQIELKAGSDSKVLELSTVYGVDGAYKAPFYPTAPVELTYRVFGTIENTPVDISFSCSSSGHNMVATTTDTSRIDVGNGIARVSQKGTFSCPTARDDVNFPDNVQSLSSLKSGTRSMGAGALIASALALVLAFAAYRKR